ncbi:MAG: flippase [Candidatus Falkowbacteria bacterium]
MPEKITNIAKNTSYFTLALVLQKVISFTYFIILARAIGPEDLGKYYFAISFTSIFAIFIDIGQSSVLTREIAKAQNRASEIFSTIFLIKLPLAIISFLAVFGIINFLGYPEITRQLVYLSSICMVLDSFTLTFFAVSRGFHNLKYESISSIIFQLIVFIIIIFALKLNLGLRWLILSLVAASSYNFIYSFYILKRKWRLKINWRPNIILSKSILAISAPFAIYAIFQRIYTYLDTVLLSFFSGDQQAGVYQVPFKIIFALQFLPLAFVASLFPALSHYWHNNRDQLSITFERAMNYLIIISLPIAAGGLVLADKIVLLFKTGFDGAILPLRITMVSLIFVFLNFAVGSLLNACDRQKRNTFNMGAVLAASVLLNFILIPKFAAVGASLTALITNILMFILGMLVIPQITKYDYKKIIFITVKSLAAVAVMGAVGYHLKSQINLILAVILAGAVYLVALYVFKGYNKTDLISIYQAFGKNKV